MITPTAQNSFDGQTRVGFLTEGTYPFLGGGVSTWSDLLLTGLSMVNFHVIATTSQPFKTPRYALPANVYSVTQIPLWGAQAADSIRRESGFFQLARQRVQTTERLVQKDFVPPFRVWLRCLFGESDKQNWGLCGVALAKMAAFLREQDYGGVFRSLAVWEAYVDAVESWYRPVPLSVAV